VGWLGGLLIWVSAMAVLAPLNLGGYEVTSEARVEGQIQTSLTQTGASGAAERLRRSAAQLTPVYGLLTILLSHRPAGGGGGPAGGGDPRHVDDGDLGHHAGRRADRATRRASRARR
jgi:hypothetical protein